MRHEVEIHGRIRQVVVGRADDGFAVEVDGRTWQVDAVQVDPHTLSLLIGDRGVLQKEGREDPVAEEHAAVVSAVFGPRGASVSYEVTVAPDPASAQFIVNVAGPTGSVGRRVTPVLVALNGRRRRRQGEDGRRHGSGPQRIVAPMPGKIVRLLVKPGEAVRARQPVVVIEAMKMENELSADRDGTVAEIHAREGISVEAGALLVVLRSVSGPHGDDDSSGADVRP